MHLRAEGNGRLMMVALTPGQRHEATVFETLMEGGAVSHKGRGRPKIRPHRVIGDKEYSSGKIRRCCCERKMRITISRRVNECRTGPFDRVIYRSRNRIERLAGRFKHYRRLATRYEKCGENYRAMWVNAATILWVSAILLKTELVVE